MEQRSEDWYQARAGKITGSNFSAALGLNPYKSRQALWRELTGRAEPQASNSFTKWGTDNEPIACDWYEAETGNIVRPIGFVVHPRYDFIGVSPDGLIGNDGGIEIKCPVNKLYDGIPEYYLPQVLGCLHITERDWWDFVCWMPSEARIIRVEKNAKQWAEWESQLVEFWQFVIEDREPPRKRRK